MHWLLQSCIAFCWPLLSLLLYRDAWSPPTAGAGPIRLPRASNSLAERLNLLRCSMLWFLWALDFAEPNWGCPGPPEALHYGAFIGH
jgi:hypothetical protein